MNLPIDPESIKGFLREDEGACLYRHAAEAACRGVCLEVGTYCGRSATYIGTACQAAGGVLFAVDHHRGSEENQPGWPWHDAELWDDEAGALDSLPSLRKTLRRAGLEDTVLPVIGRSSIISRVWRTPLSFVFIDGGHTMEHALNDYRGWVPHLIPDGVLAIHDVFPNPADGGGPPFEIYQLALRSGLFEEVEAVASLRVLRRISPG